MVMRHHQRGAVALSVLLSTCFAKAEEPEPGQTYEVYGYSESHAQLFRRALLPGPNGAIVTTDTEAPLNEYVGLVGRGFDTPLGEDSVDIELAGWGGIEAGEPGALGRYDGDVQTANLVLRRSADVYPASLRLGRQQVAGGAARFARFDGAMGSIELVPALSLSAYGGWSVLPRWDHQPGYYLLGSTVEGLVRDPEALESVERSGYWLVGGRVSVHHELVDANLSVHEQRESGGLARRNLGLDARSDLTPDVGLGGNLLFELDASRIADLRLWSDLSLFGAIDLNLEYLRTEPALLLSRQSVLSVFSTDGYHETGGMARWHVTDEFSLAGGGWLELYDDSDPGARLDTNLRFASRGFDKTVVSLSYVRVLGLENGYHSLRAALSRRVLGPLTSTLQLYAYLYDEPIDGYRTSSVYSTTLEYAVLDRLSLLWGGSVARSPYASLDASTQLRLSYQFYAPGGRQTW